MHGIFLSVVKRNTSRDLRCLIQSFVRFFVKTRLTEFILEMIQLVILEFFSFPEILCFLGNRLQLTRVIRAS